MWTISDTKVTTAIMVTVSVSIRKPTSSLTEPIVAQE